MRSEMTEASRNHRKIASNIRELVVNPFSRWCDQHAARVQNSHDDLQARIKAHDRQAETVRQYRSSYYNKCRRVEDLDEEEKLAFQDPNSAAATATTGSPKPAPPPSVPSIKVEEEDDEEPEPIEIGDETYQPEQVKKILTHLLNTIRLGETKVPILGTYQNVSTGAEITEYIQKHMGGTTVSYAEKIGQDLIGHGFLRLIGNMGNTFANSSKMNYQWRTKVFQITGIPEKRPKLTGRTSTVQSMGASDPSSVPGSPVIGDRVSEYLGNWNPLNNANPNETAGDKLRREAREADERYKLAVKKLDGLRCKLEEAMVDHLKFMERCELDRLKAIKSVILDFSGAISNVIPSLQSTVDNMMLFQETVQPAGDLRYLLENYRTGNYFPKVTTYENYYNKVDEETFGVDIEARARSDRKRVPLIVTTILTFLDSRYPDLEGDETRRSIWIVDVPLAATHHLRSLVNTGKPISPELLEKYEIPIVAAVLKLYLLELPDSLVSSHVYEIIKTIYTTTAQTAPESARVQVIQSTLGQLRLANIATLDALITHFTRLIELTSADEEYISTLASILSPCIMRPKQENGLTMTEKYNVRLVRDLFAHKNDIFGELKRQSALTHTNSGSTRQVRGISTDESKRREHMEERQRAIAAAQLAAQNGGGTSSRSRASSPGPSARGPMPDGPTHRRDRSRGPETRFPVSTTAIQGASERRIISPTTSTSSSHRDSLSVPETPPGAAARQQTGTNVASPPKYGLQSDVYDSSLRTNGSLHRPPPQEASSDESAARQRSESEAVKQPISIIPPMSATINSPSDFMSPRHYDSHSGLDHSSTAGGVASSEPSSSSATGAKTNLSKFKMGNPDEPVTESPVDSSGTPTKKDSLGRSSVRVSYPRRGTGGGGVQRQSVDSAHYSESGGDATTVNTTKTADEQHGVQLEDKPVDFD